ncbi:MAG: gamma-glutamyltransferase [Parvibaculaceae bacterium]|nr:gamma-glutamyltransferase [Parvibaculaceae bacterium]
MNKTRGPAARLESGRLRAGSRLACLTLAGLLLAACSSSSKPFWSGNGTTSDGPATNAFARAYAPVLADLRSGKDTNDSFQGAVVADEPQAALIAQRILEQGGKAGDAAAALYFALSVTYPAAAGLGGGGLCLAHAPGEAGIESVSFLPRKPEAGGGIAVPGNVRGIAYVQAKYGVMAWPSVVGPAQALAATGFTVSNASAARIVNAVSVLNENPALARQFSGDGGLTAASGSTLMELDLAGTLSAIRQQNIAGFYAGPVARALVSASADAGGKITLADLNAYRNDIAPAQQIVREDVTLSLPSDTTNAGIFTANLLKTLGTAKASDAAALAATAQQVAGQMGAPAALDADMGSTSFAVVDGRGGAVACAVTMNGPFGTGKLAGSTGVVFASAPSTPVYGLASTFLSPVLVVGGKKNSTYFAGAAAGAPKAVAALALSSRLLDDENLTARQVLAQGPLDAVSTANLIYCPDGLPGKGVCDTGINPAGAGIGLTASAADR